MNYSFLIKLYFFFNFVLKKINYLKIINFKLRNLSFIYILLYIFYNCKTIKQKNFKVIEKIKFSLKNKFS